MWIVELMFFLFLAPYLVGTACHYLFGEALRRAYEPYSMLCALSLSSMSVCLFRRVDQDGEAPYLQPLIVMAHWAPLGIPMWACLLIMSFATGIASVSLAWHIAREVRRPVQ